VSDKLQKYLNKAKVKESAEKKSIPVNGDNWSIKKLNTLEVRKCYDMTLDEDGKPKDGFSAVSDTRIVMATEHDFPWQQLTEGYGVESKYQLPPLVFDDPEEYTKINRAVQNFHEIKEILVEEAKN
jgi:hypothetical protein